MLPRHCYLISLIFCLSANATAQHAGYLDDWLSKWDHAHAYTRAFAEAMPDNLYDFRPTDEEMSFAHQLEHMVRNMTWLANSYFGADPFPVELPREGSNPPRSKEELLALLDQAFAYVRQAVADTPPEAWDEQVDFFAGPMSRRKVSWLLFDHLTHHRGQLVVYLRLNGITPPRYVGW